jgi:Kae1-associated kinase Bud32
MKQKIIQQGAEAKILHQKNNIIKHRISKGYRHPDLDKKIIKRRSKSEAKLLNKAASLIPSPKAELNDFNKISMPYLQGKKLSENLEKLNWKTISKTIGEQIAALHDGDIIHGDLTTSNMIFLKNKLYFIDFGLGYISNKIEDKAVDLHLIRQALEAKHFSIWKSAWQIITKNYKSKDKKQILERLKKVESRGRYKKGC